MLGTKLLKKKNYFNYSYLHFVDLQENNLVKEK